MHKYDKIIDKKLYNNLVLTGFFFEVFPELTGDYEADMVLIEKMVSK